MKELVVKSTELTDTHFNGTLEPARRMEPAESVEVKVASLEAKVREGRSRTGNPYKTVLRQFIVDSKKFWITVDKELNDYFNETTKVGLVDIPRTDGQYTQFINLRPATV